MDYVSNLRNADSKIYCTCKDKLMIQYDVKFAPFFLKKLCRFFHSNGNATDYAALDK